jgi:hypothetical protein
MPTKAKAALLRFTAWSWSRFNDHRRCAFYAFCKYLRKLPEPGSPAMDRGGAIHKLAEDWTLGKGDKLPPELKLFKTEFAHLRKIKANVEGQIAVDRMWKPTDWFGKDAWLRVVTDARYEENPKDGKVVSAIDHKTGKIYEENDEQLSLYIPALFSHYPRADEINLKLYYLDQGEERLYRYRREGIARPRELPPARKGGAPVVEKAPSHVALMKIWTEKSYPILTDRQFVATPNDKCRFCHYRKSNGGPCRY